jgi:uracil-DNA glycosylase
LERELQAVQPRVVLLLGRHAAPFILKHYLGIHVGRLSDVVARPYPCTIGEVEVIAVPTLHPTGAGMAGGGSAKAYASTRKLVKRLLDG